MVFYEGNENLQNLMYPVQFNSKNAQDFDWLNREINQMIQETSPVVNMQNKYNSGGMNNDTLGAVQMQASLGEVLYGYVMTNVAYHLERIAEVNATIMLQNLDDSIQLRLTPNDDPLTLAKAQLLGEYCYKAKSNYFINDKSERVDKANLINQVLNWKGTQQPDFQGIQLQPLIKDFLRAWVGQSADLSEYLKQAPQGAPMPQVGPPPQAPSPAPASQPPPGGPAA
jgi:hypothetical protein